MSRGGSDDYDETFPNEGEFWLQRARMASTSRRGKKALADLREALLALPERRLISRALCTVGKQPEGRTPWIPEGRRDWRQDYVNELLTQQGEGVCAVGAYIWHQKVKGGADPETAMRELPLLDDDVYTIHDTAEAGRDAGLTYTLAWILADQNDETYRGATPEERWEKFMAYLNKQLGLPVTDEQRHAGQET